MNRLKSYNDLVVKEIVNVKYNSIQKTKLKNILKKLKK